MEDLTSLSDQELSGKLTQYVYLHQQANVEKRLELVLRREEIRDMYDAIHAELSRRGKKHCVGLYGETWLEPCL